MLQGPWEATREIGVSAIFNRQILRLFGFFVSETLEQFTCKISIFWKQFIFKEKSSIFSLDLRNVMCDNVRTLIWELNYGKSFENIEDFYWKCTALRKHWLKQPTLSD